MNRPVATAGKAAFLAVVIVAGACDFDRADRWLLGDDRPPAGVCRVGERRCTNGIERCQNVAGAPVWVLERDCAAVGLVCAPTLLECTSCLPGAGRCEGQSVLRCDAAGAGFAEQ